MDMADVWAIVEKGQNRLAAGTRHSYGCYWRRYRRFCVDHDYDILPPDPYVVASFAVKQQQRGLTAKTIRCMLSAIGYYAKEKDMKAPLEFALVRKVMHGIERDCTHQPRQAKGISESDMEAIRRTACEPRQTASGRVERQCTATKRGRKEVALIAVMRDALLRRSEASALTWGDVEFHEDGSGIVIIRRSKTSLSARALYIGPEAVADLKRYMPTTNPDPKARIWKWSGETIRVHIRDTCKAAGLEGDYTGHSCRVGMAQTLVENGCTMAALKQAGRWKDGEIASRYVEHIKERHGAVAQLRNGRLGAMLEPGAAQ